MPIQPILDNPTMVLIKNSYKLIFPWTASSKPRRLYFCNLEPKKTAMFESKPWCFFLISPWSKDSKILIHKFFYVNFYRLYSKQTKCCEARLACVLKLNCEIIYSLKFTLRRIYFPGKIDFWTFLSPVHWRWWRCCEYYFILKV